MCVRVCVVRPKPHNKHLKSRDVRAVPFSIKYHHIKFDYKKLTFTIRHFTSFSLSLSSCLSIFLSFFFYVKYKRALYITCIFTFAYGIPTRTVLLKQFVKYFASSFTRRIDYVSLNIFCIHLSVLYRNNVGEVKKSITG